MKNNGFTLVELLAVIGIISVILLVIVPTVDLVLKEQRNRLYDGQKKSIQEALKLWGNINIDLLPKNDGDIITLTLNDLKKDGLVEDNIKNPRSDKCYKNSNEFIIVKIKESYNYIVNDLIDGNNDTDCTLIVTPTK